MTRDDFIKRNRRRDRNASILAVLIVVLGIAFIAGLAAIPTYFEMQSFNRNTGCDVTFFDALFTELRFTGQSCK
jgi:cytochrome c oxidase assembly protein Cox11